MNSSLSTEEAIERRTKRRQAEGTIFSLEADRSHLVREQTGLGTTLHGLHQSLRTLEAQIGEQEAKLKHVEGKLAAIDEEIQQAKKTLRLI